MHKPLPSVVALARFDFTDAERELAGSLLDQEKQWQEWLNQIELHGLSGFANKHIEEQGFTVPMDVRLSLKALKMRHTSAAHVRYKTLSQITEVFSSQSIPFVALKGAALMSYLYGDAALRPMRDMDLLLPKDKLSAAANCLREIGFDLPDEQPSKFMRDMHQLPNATKTIDGFLSSVELHGDGISREVPGHFYYPTSEDGLQVIKWGELNITALDDLSMIHQVSKHLEGLHSGAVLKLINVMDVIGLALLIERGGQWPALQRRYPHVVNTLRCLHLHTPLPASLQRRLTPLSSHPMSGVGQIMGSLRNALVANRPLSERYQLLLRPSDWWLHLYYNVDPNKSLWWIKTVRHPLRVINWLSRRFYSGLLGG